MTNYEKHKEKIDKILQDTYKMAVDKNEKEIVDCRELNCMNCLFSYCYNESRYCEINRIKWLVAEYKEPEIDWSKVPIDTPVLVSNNGEKWYCRYFASVDDEGKPLVFPDGRTSWSNARCSRMWTSYKYIELAEVE